MKIIIDTETSTVEEVTQVLELVKVAQEQALNQRLNNYEQQFAAIRAHSDALKEMQGKMVVA